MTSRADGSVYERELLNPDGTAAHRTETRTASI
jgi:hypothetical protein